MATIKKVIRKRGVVYKIGFIHPDTRKWTSRTAPCSYADALKIKAQIEADLAFGKFGLQNDRLKKYYWSQLLNRYRKYSNRNKSPKTTDREENVFTAFNKFLSGDTPLDDISSESIEIYKERWLKGGISPATVSIELRVLKTVFNKAIEWKFININPVWKVKIPKSEDVTVRFLRKEEIDKLIQVIEDDKNTPFLRLILAYLHTGARRNEILSPQFTWDNVDFEERKIMICGVKGEKNRYIPMNNTLFNILDTIKVEGNQLPFSYKPYYVSHKIAKYYKLAGIKGANLHSLRKTFGSLLIQHNKADLYTVSLLLGHRSIKTTEKYYVDLLDKNFRDSVSGLDEII